MPRHDGVADMAEAMRRERGRPRLPTKSDAAAELSVPEPPPVAWKSRYGRAVWQRDRAALCVAIDHAVQKGPGIAAQSAEFFGGGDFATDAVGRPPALEGCFVTGDVVRIRRDEVHV